ncbi:hypothetical protein LTR53_017376 [Teratosphaeriaceae sp. CCFEE 6253]|nr:hypothetical protein LTR53_017376 [Teratosphaeriaceae sp. CCFEE 6253]
MQLLLFLSVALMALALPHPQRGDIPKAMLLPVVPTAPIYYYHGTPNKTLEQIRVWTFDERACMHPHMPEGTRDFCELTQSTTELFKSDRSSTSRLLGNESFEILFGGGSRASGDWFSESFGIGSLAGQNLSMGFARLMNFIEEQSGMLGLGPDFGQLTPGSSILQVMQQQGLIHTRSFSLALGQTLDHVGGLLFGGHDPSKYHGPITVLPLRERSFVYDINVSSIALTSSGRPPKTLTPDGYTAWGTVDSGSPNMGFPQGIYVEVAKALGLDGDAAIPCDRAKEAGSLQFEFGGQGEPSCISMPLANLMDPLHNISTGAPLMDKDGSALCKASLDSADASDEPGVVFLNVLFLRSAYVVHNLEEMVLGIAQARTDVDQASESLDSVVEIKHGDSMWKRPSAAQGC